jgi:hypothetical protein
MRDWDMRAWRDRAVADGNDPEEVVRLLYEQTADLRRCVACGASIALWTARPPAGMLAREHELPGLLCPKCDEGPVGHDAYHRDVDQYRRFAAACMDQPDGKLLARQTAERSHAACPWAARGVECERAKSVSKVYRE